MKQHEGLKDYVLYFDPENVLNILIWFEALYYKVILFVT